MSDKQEHGGFGEYFGLLIVTAIEVILGIIKPAVLIDNSFRNNTVESYFLLFLL